jgi:hypothetical protein
MCQNRIASLRAVATIAFAVAAAGLGAVIEAVQGPRLQDTLQAASTSTARGRRSAFAGAAAAGRRVAGLADLGAKAEIGDQLAAGQEPSRVADGGDERRGADQVDAGRRALSPVREPPSIGSVRY